MEGVEDPSKDVSYTTEDIKHLSLDIYHTSDGVKYDSLDVQHPLNHDFTRNFHPCKGLEQVFYKNFQKIFPLAEKIIPFAREWHEGHE